MAESSVPLASAVAVEHAGLLAEWESLPKAPVSSSNVAVVAYNWTAHRAFVSFKNGGLYAYEGVPEGVWLGFVHAPSKGQYLWRIIRNNGQDNRYACTTIVKGAGT